MNTIGTRMLTAELAAASTLSGLVVHWIGRYRESILFGWLCWTAGLAAFSTLDAGSGLGKQIGFGILTGVGVGNTLQPYVEPFDMNWALYVRHTDTVRSALIAIQAGVEPREMAVVTSFRK
jgi:hypothetical protein